MMPLPIAAPVNVVVSSPSRSSYKHDEPAPKPTPPAAPFAIVLPRPPNLPFFCSSGAGCVEPVESVVGCEELELLYEPKLDVL